MKHIPYYLFTFLLFTLSGCIEEFEADIPADDAGLLVVEGTICSSRQNTFVLSRTQPLRNDQGYMAFADGWNQSPAHLIQGAVVSVRGTDGSKIEAQPANGSYTCWVDALSPDVGYYLHIELDGEVYESEPQRPLPTESIAEVRGVQNTQESPVDVLVTPDNPLDSNQTAYYSWTYDETWEVHADYTTIMYFDIATMMRIFQANLFPERGWKDAQGTTVTVGASTNYEGQHIEQLKIYDIDRRNERIYYMYSGLVHQRAITKAEYEYELARRQASSEMGGLFTPQPSALPTNIHCLTSTKHVIGFIGCALNMSEYRFFLDAADLSVDYLQRDDARLWLKACSEADCRRQVLKGMHLCEWEDNRISGGVLRTAWASESQLDVRYKGAYIEEPDFWPQDEQESYENE